MATITKQLNTDSFYLKLITEIVCQLIFQPSKKSCCQLTTAKVAFRFF